MTDAEVKKILMLLEVTYPNFNVAVEKRRATVDMWQMMLGEYDYKDVEAAVVTFVKTSGSAFAPNPSQLIAMMHKVAELSTLTDADAWVMVRKAIGRSAYHSVEEFNKLPEQVQRALGGPEQLRYWAIDEHFNEGVAMSNFKSVYDVIVKRDLEVAKLPVQLRDAIAKKRQDLLEVHDGEA